MHQVSLKLMIAATAVVGVGDCQVQLPGFEVASVKPTASADGRSLLQAVPGRLMMTNVALRRLILIAYDIQDDQLLGDPPWVGSEHYDIQAKADENASVQQMEGPMLRALLGERFKLLIRREIRQLAVYKLSVGMSRTKLQASQEGSCTPYIADAPPPTTKPGEPLAIFCGFQHTDQGLIRSLDGKGVTMTELARTLSRSYVASLGRNVIDDSGLTGRFDIHLTWTIDPLTASDVTGPSIFTALQEQLGLKLESAKDSVEVLVIEHIEKPSAN